METTLPQSPEEVPDVVSPALAYQLLAEGRPRGDAHEIVVDGARCPVIIAGKGRPILLIHGLGHDCADWAEVFARRPRGVRLVALDLPGFGLSEHPRSGCSLRTLTAAVKAAAAFCDEPPVLAGSSLGGHLAMLAALDGLPCAGLHLAAPGGLERVPPPMQAVARAYYGQGAICARPERELVGNTKKLFGKGGPAADKLAAKKLALHRSPLVRERARSVAEVVRDVFHHVVIGRAAELPRPVAVLWGDRDPLVPSRGLNRLAAQPGISLTTLEGVGHVPMLEVPDAYAAHLFAFAERAHARQES